MNICLWTPAVGGYNGEPSSNLGDLIIEEAILGALKVKFSKVKNVERVSTQLFPKRRDLEVLHRADLIFVAGSNLLSSNMLPNSEIRGLRFGGYRQWKLPYLLKKRKKIQSKLILMGVGWWQYQEPPDFLTQILLRNTLSSEIVHSVRDEFTASQLRGIGIRNVINTGCPTTWDLPSTVNTHELAESVLFTITDYLRDKEADEELLVIVNEYPEVYFWEQGAGDVEYLKSLKGYGSHIQILSGPHECIERLRARKRFDYIGTRLHCGIKCLQLGCNSAVIEVDNRAREIAKDISLPTLRRDCLKGVRAKDIFNNPVELKINHESIDLWIQQFLK